MNVGVFVNVSNLYHSVGKKYDSKVDYSKLLARLVDTDTLFRAIAYVDDQPDASRFLAYLRHVSFEPKFGSDLDLALDVVRLLDKLDIVYICTSNTWMLPLFQYVKERGSKVVVVGSNINYALRNAADSWIEIKDTELLEVSDITN